MQNTNSKMKSQSQAQASATMVALAVLFLAITAVSAVDPPKIVIHVASGLKPGGLLDVDCVSDGVDFGRFTFKSGDDFKWRFNNDIWGVGKFFCSFWWDSKAIKLDLYTSKCDVKAGEVWFMADEEGVLVRCDNHPGWIRQCPWGFH